MLLEEQYYNYESQVPPLVKKEIDPCFSHSLHRSTEELTRTAKHTKTLTDHILENSP